MSYNISVRAEKNPSLRKHWDWLTNDEKDEIRLRRHCGEPTKSVCWVMGVSQGTVAKYAGLPRQRLPAGMGHDREKLRAKWQRKYRRGKIANYNFGALRAKLWRYDMTMDQWDALFESHHHRCAICRSTSQLAVDHDHQTRKVRGILCGKCNRGLGQLGDTIQAVERALAYLKARS